ncbi:MAG: glycosyltransferase [Planctomycetota bacterium]
MPDAARSPAVALLVDSLNARARRSRHPERLVRGLSARGWQAEVVPVTAGMLGLLPRDGAGDAAQGPEQVERADVLLAYDTASPAAWLGARLARRLGKPLVLVEPAWFSLRSWHERARERTGRAMWGRIVRNEARAVVCLDPVAVERVRSYGYREEDTHLVVPPVDTDEFRPGVPSRVVSRLHVTGRFVLCVGHLEHGRGLDVLVRAFGRTVGQGGDWSLVLAGSGSLETRLEALAYRVGAAGTVRIVALPPQEELPGLFAGATLFCAPSEDDRVRGRNLSHAIAAGLPCIASDLPRLRLRVEHERNGLIVQPDDEQALASALKRACGGPEVRRRWAAESRRIAVERFSIPAVAARYDEILRPLLES